VGSFCAGVSWLHLVAFGCIRLHWVAGSGFVLLRGEGVGRVGTDWNGLARVGVVWPRLAFVGTTGMPTLADRDGARGGAWGGRGKAWHPETGSLGEGGVVVRAWCLHLLGGWCAVAMRIPGESRFLE
jgi:hypothetical protein